MKIHSDQQDQLAHTPSPRVMRILVPEKTCYVKTILVETPFMYTVLQMFRQFCLFMM